MTDNAFVYTNSRRFRGLLAAVGARHIVIPPYTPRWNSKVERFIGTLLAEWAYARPYASSGERARALSSFVRFYNRRRPHTSLGGNRHSAAFTTSVGRTARRGSVLARPHGQASRGALFARNYSTARAIADNGDVAGWSLEQNGQPMANAWRRGQLIRLGNPRGHFASKAYGSNDLGQIVGEATESTAFRLDAVQRTLR
jgi:Integrase core domain